MNVPDDRNTVSGIAAKCLESLKSIFQFCSFVRMLSRWTTLVCEKSAILVPCQRNALLFRSSLEPSPFKENPCESRPLNFRF